VVSAIFEPSIRLLHALQTLIYIAVIVLTRRESAWGFGAGCIIAAFWNYLNLFVTTFISAGLEQVSILLHTGSLPPPDLLIAVFAAAGHFLLIIGCLAGFVRTGLTFGRLGQFVAGGSLAVSYFALIIVLPAGNISACFGSYSICSDANVDCGSHTAAFSASIAPCSLRPTHPSSILLAQAIPAS